MKIYSEPGQGTTALLGCLPKGGLRHSNSAVFIRIERTEMATDDFGLLISLDTLCTGVPGCNVPGRVKLEYGVVDDCLDQPTISTLAVGKLKMSFQPIADVPCNLCEANKLPVMVSNRIDHDHGPELASVLSDPPALRMVAARLSRHPQRLVRNPGRAVLLSVKIAEMSANDFARRVLLEALSAGIPTDHTALDVEHDDRVVDDGIKQKLEVERFRRGGQTLPTAVWV